MLLFTKLAVFGATFSSTWFVLILYAIGMRRFSGTTKEWDSTVDIWAQLQPVWPDWAIFCTLGNHSKPVVIILPKLPTLFRNFCKGVKIIIFLLKSFWATFIDNWWFLSGHTAGVFINFRLNQYFANKLLWCAKVALLRGANCRHRRLEWFKWICRNCLEAFPQNKK